MMRFKSDGFSLIEPMLAILLVGMVFAPLFVLENTVFDNVIRVTEQFNRCLFAHNFLYEARQQQSPNIRDFSLEQKKEPPPTTLKYRLKKVADKGIFKATQNLYMEKIEIDGGISKDVLISYQFKPQVIKNEK